MTRLAKNEKKRPKKCWHPDTDLQSVLDAIQLVPGAKRPDAIYAISINESVGFSAQNKSCNCLGPPWPIVMIDQIAGPESAKEIAPNMVAFIEAIGIEAEGQDELFAKFRSLRGSERC